MTPAWNRAHKVYNQETTDEFRLRVQRPQGVRSESFVRIRLMDTRLAPV